MLRRCAVAIGFALAGLSQTVLAQNFPSKPIHVVVAFPAGSSADSALRTMTPPMQADLGRQIIVESRPGAASIPAMQYIKSQPADGYSLFYMTSTLAVTSAMPQPPYDIRKDLTMVAGVLATPLYLAVNSEKMPAKTVAELIAYIRANPGKVNFSSYGMGSLAHLSLELLSQRLNLQVLHVPYKGSADNVRALAAGDSHVTFDVGNVLFTQVDSGRVRILASSSENSWPTTPQYPGMKAAGIPDFNAVIWNGFAGPAGLPPPITRRLNAAINVALQDPLAIEYGRKSAYQMTPGTPEEFSQMVRKEIDTWSAVIRNGNINLQ